MRSGSFSTMGTAVTRVTPSKWPLVQNALDEQRQSIRLLKSDFGLIIKKWLH